MPKIQKNLNIWNVTPKEARIIQEELKNSSTSTPLPRDIRYIAGADVSFNKFEKDVYAGIIVLSYPDLTPVEHAVVKMEVTFPYIPGFLSFREIPPLLACYEKLRITPDVTVIDGHGIAHPRRLGIAAHFGLAIQKSTMGVAKNILYGEVEEPAISAHSYTYIIDPKTNEKIGITYRSKNGVKPIFISPGNQADIESVRTLALSLIRKHRLPEPTRMAHNLVNAFRKGEIKEGYFKYPDNRLF